ncbi:MAG: ATP-binding protein [Methylovulum sp.]|nr:ATP-binding protein [Methylovulum sp.]
MPKNTTDTLFPCPFSKGYGIPAQQAWRLLKIFVTYRLVLASLFMVLIYGRVEFSEFGPSYNTLYIYSSQSYLIITLISGICILRGLTSYTMQAQLLIFSDIIILTLLMHACGGIKSGIGILLAVSIASGGLLIGGRCAMLFAALAALSVLTEQAVSEQYRNVDNNSYTYAGMLGAAFFTIALLSHILTKRSEETLQLAKEQKQTIIKLEDLNQHIIQHLQSGIIITDPHQAIHIINESALRLAHLDVAPNNIGNISPQLAHAFQTWLNHPEHTFLQLENAGQNTLHIHFEMLPTQHEIFYMITLEDATLYNQRLQQSKLASLGRLTASIAHEIRNPLGAISHAGQLLSEMPNLSSQDRRLTEIIKNHCTRVNYIIEDILQLSKRSDSRKEKIELNAWLNDYLHDFILENAIVAETFMFLPVRQPLPAIIDPGQLKQIMDNLCQNALRYGKPELGAIAVRSFRFKHSPCIEIIDNGGGINPEHLKHLFEPFFTTSSSGTGLGLYISKELAELNQAKLSYYLTPENRSCFRLCLMDAEKNLIAL